MGVSTELPAQHLHQPTCQVVLSDVLRYPVLLRAPLPELRIKPAALVLSFRSLPSAASFGEKWEELCSPSF